jgi:hypothetical protein
MSGAELLQAALERVESDSIRRWAGSDHNRPLFEEHAQGALDKGDGAYDPDRYAAWIVCLAIGA